MPPIDRLASRLRRRIVLGEFLRLAGRWFAIFLLVFGLVVLGVKLFAPDYWPHVLWGACLLPLLGAWLARRARRLAPSGPGLIGLLDDRLSAGGLLMTLSEHPDPRWNERLPHLDRSGEALPAIIPEPFARAIVVPLMFSAGALALPSRNAPPPTPRPTLASDVADELETALGVLQRSESVDPATTAALAREIGQLTTSIEGGPLTDESWETVDALRGRMQSALDSTDQSLFQGELAVSALINTMTQGASASPEETARLRQELGQAMRLLEERGALKELSGRLAEDLSTRGEPPTGQAVRQLIDDPATRKLALSALGSVLSQERNELDQTRRQLAGTLGGSQTDSSRSPSESSGLARSSSTVGDLTGRAQELGETVTSSAASLQEILLPTNVVAPLIPGGDAKSAGSAHNDGTPSDRVPSDHDSSAIAEAPMTTEHIDPDVPTEVFSQSSTWKRELRPRHRDVIRGYFRDGS